MKDIKCPICGGELVVEVYNATPTKEELKKADNKEIFLVECNAEDVLEEVEELMAYHCYKCSTSFSEDLKRKEKVYYSNVIIQDKK